MTELSHQDRVMQAVDAVLRCGPMSVDSRFADLGGDSIQAVQVLARCWREFAVELPLRALRPTTTIAELVDAIRLAARRDDVDHERGDPSEQPVGSGASPRQEALYALCTGRPDAPTYNVPVALWLTGALDLGRLSWAVQELLGRHEALRTTFRTGNDGRPLMVVRPVAEASLDEVDLSSLGAAEREAATAAVIRDAAVRPLDLGRSPVRLLLARLGADRHVLVFVAHHLVCDGWALNLLLRDLCRLYGDGPDAAYEPAVSAGRMAEREAARLSAGRHALIRRWAELLEGAPALVQLPTDRPRPRTPSFRGARVPLSVDAPLLAALRERAAATGVTPFTLLGLAFGVLLARHTGQRDLVIGVPMANRRRPDELEVVGYLSNTVPVRLDLSGDPPLTVALARVQEAVLASEEAADLSFDTIVSALAIHRDPSHSPLFQVALVLLTNGAEPLRLPGLSVRRVDLDTGTSKFDQTWYLEERAGSLEGYVEFATDLFEPASVDRMRGHFINLLRAIATAVPAQRLGDLPMLGGQERAELIQRLTPPASGPAPDVIDEFMAQVRARPEHPALWCAEGEVSYGELHARAQRVAALLRTRGVGPEALVGVCVARSADQIAAVLAVLLAGAAYLPLDPAYPAERLRYMVADSGARLVLAGAAHLDLLAGEGVDLLVLDDLDVEARDFSPVRTDSGGLAYVIYTSGSTGRPKGVELTRGGLANVIEHARRRFDLTVERRVFQFVSFSFDVSVWDIFMALAAGATLCLAPPDPARDTRSVAEMMTVARADLVFLPPAVLGLVAPDDAPSVRLVLTGGDRVPAELRDKWLGRARFFAVYGPTEGTIVQTWGECPPGQKGPPPIGQPFGGVRVYVLDSRLEPVPYGAVGEVYVGGLATGRGYRHRRALTAERFLPDPYAETPGERMYRTGDLVRRRADGELVFVGRTDHQVKVRGFRVELGEVEAALVGQPGVAESLALMDTAASGQAQLVGFVVPRDGQASAQFGAQLRQRLRAQLPEHLVPARVCIVPTFPRTVNGKVDHAALRAMAGVAAEDLADLLDRLDRLTDDEAEALLSQYVDSGGGN